MTATTDKLAEQVAALTNEVEALKHAAAERASRRGPSSTRHHHMRRRLQLQRARPKLMRRGVRAADTASPRALRSSSSAAATLTNARCSRHSSARRSRSPGGSRGTLRTPREGPPPACRSRTPSPALQVPRPGSAPWRPNAGCACRLSSGKHCHLSAICDDRDQGDTSRRRPELAKRGAGGRERPASHLRPRPLERFCSPGHGRSGG